MRKVKISILMLLIVFVLFGYTSNNNNNLILEAQASNDRQLKAVWVTPFVSDVTAINTENGFKNRLTTVLDNMESYGYNALIFHVRTHNNALYPSSLNPKADFVNNINFSSFDPLEWLVAESHKRGIELHAWLNPYRTGDRHTGSIPTINPASSTSNIITSTSGEKFLDPAKQVVKTHIANTVKEIIENYDVDAIHFDDYFYLKTPSSYGLSENQKRGHVDDMVETVHNTITAHNQTYNKHVQFGIAPTGIWRNANSSAKISFVNGKVITNGTPGTTGQQHYHDYLCADTLKWMNEGWLDYIMPQIYWERTRSAAPFKTVLDWWDEVASYLNINLYVGIGLSQALDSSWGNDPYELSAQLTLIDNAANVQGFSMYSYGRMFASSGATKTQMDNAYNSRPDRKQIRVLPVIQSMTPIVPANVSVNHLNGNLNWTSSGDAKFYYLYRSTGTLTYSDSEIFKVVGKDILSHYTGDTTNQYNYGVKALSPTNHLSGQSVDDPIGTTYNINYVLNGGTYSGYNGKNEIITAFLTDFYQFVQPSDTLTTFMHGSSKTSGFAGTWYSNEEYRNLLYTINIQSGNNDFFLSHSSYQAKWKPFADFMVSFVAINPQQSFWGSRSTGTLRMSQYFTNVKPGAAWSDEVMASIPTGLSQTIITVYNKNSPAITLPVVEKANNTFLGWYTANTGGTKVTSIPTGSTGDKTFYARWQDNTPITYQTVNFNLGYGGQTLPSVQVVKGSAVIEPTNPTREGFTFIGWYLNGVLYDFNTPINSNVTLIAQWQDNTPIIDEVTINFSLGYSGLTLPSITINKGSLVTKPYDPTRSGYTFIGWYLGDELYNFNNSVNDNIILVAHWKENVSVQVSVTFDYDYDNIKNVVSIIRDTKVTKPTDPVRSGYIFRGWFLANNLYDFNEIVTHNIILYAKWDAEDVPVQYVNVTFDHDYDNIKTVVSVIRDTKVAKPTDPVRDGYRFLRWELANEAYDFNEIVTHSFVLYAKWEKIATIDYVDVIFDYGYDNLRETVSVARHSKAIKPADPTREGYTFIGWHFVNEPYDFDSPVAFAITLIAHWEKISVIKYVDVIFDYGYDNLKDVLQNIKGNKVAKPNDPTRSGFTFIGWYLGDELYNFNNSVNDNITLTAKWKKEVVVVEKVTVTFNSDGGTTISPKEIEINSLIDKPVEPTREGYTFIGWYLNNNLFNFSNPINSNITLLAKWEIIKYVVTFDSDADSDNVVVEVLLDEVVLKPFTPYKEGYIFNGWYLGNDKYDFDTPITYSLTLTANWSSYLNLDVVSIYGKTTTRSASEGTLKGLKFYGIVNLDKTTEHGFYIVYGRVSNAELLKAIDSNNLIINNKKVYQVVVDGTIDGRLYSVTITGIPEENYDDVITVIPYAISNNKTVLSTEDGLSSMNYAGKINEINVIRLEVDLLTIKRRKIFFNNL